MQIDQNKLVNLIMEKTNQKLNSLQAQVLVLEAQLQLAADLADQLQSELEKVRKTNGKSSDKTGTY